jgi:hypothetical protein
MFAHQVFGRRDILVFFAFAGGLLCGSLPKQAGRCDERSGARKRQRLTKPCASKFVSLVK